MKALNPFQVAAGLGGNLQQTRRERFKKVFFAVLAAHVLLFLTLLIQGCRNGQQAGSQAQDSGVPAASQN